MSSSLNTSFELVITLFLLSVVSLSLKVLFITSSFSK